MANPLPSGPPSYIAGAPVPLNAMPRRTSYASIVSGITTTPQTYSQPARSGAFAHLMNPSSPTAYNSSYRPDYSIPRTSNVFEMDGLENSPADGSWARGGPLPPYSRQFANLNTYGLYGFSGTPPPSFFIPTYLRKSRYVERLEEAYKAQVALQKEASNRPSLSTSSSSVNLHRMAPSHRGMTYDIIEHHPPLLDEDLTPLPSRWSETDKNGGLHIESDDLEVRYVGPPVKPHEHEAAATRADYPMPPEIGIYYYEVTILSKGKEGMIGVGFSGQKASLERLPGWEPDSWAYHGDDGKVFCCQSTGKAFGPTFTTGDVIGCGVNFSTGVAFYTKNGVFLGHAARDLPNVKLFPSIGMKKPGAHIRVNFGQTPFSFDIDGMMAREQYNIQEEIASTPLRPEFAKDETSLIQELIAQFLSHDGYVETARAFTEEVRAEAKALNKSEVSVDKYFKDEDDVDAIHRQQIRSAILEGDIDKALKYTDTYYKTVLQENPDILFRLRCRKFIEMLRKCSEVQSASGNSSIQTSRHSSHQKAFQGTFPKENLCAIEDDHDSEIGDFSPEMEVDTNSTNPNATNATTTSTVTLADDNDEPMHDTDSASSDMSTSPPSPTLLPMSAPNPNLTTTTFKPSSTKYHELLQAAVEFGTELRLEHREDKRKEVQKTLEDTFSLLAYSDPKEAVFGHLLEESGRVSVAEELNAAILVSLGKSSAAALERMYQQSEALVDLLSEDGGPGAFINVRKDFLEPARHDL
ncbi:MAG: hypothetical protein M1834_008966 [Cirrosporium novae-zelandiae]|nr:MAG: hypothetical protein M1834_008966 [Cirrosporium novae-zelandiae]